MPVLPAEQKFFDSLEYNAINKANCFLELPIAKYRKLAQTFIKYAGRSAPVKFKDLIISVRNHREIKIRIFNPQFTKKLPALIMFPGNGYIADAFELNSIAVSRIAYYSKIKVILVDSRLAPEYPLPTPIYDALDAIQYIFTHTSELGIDDLQLMIGGMSSGAHCASVIAHCFYKQLNFKIHHIILLNGFYDLTQSLHKYSSYEAQDRLLTSEVVDYIFKHIGVGREERSLPLFSPYFSQRVDYFPKASLIVGEYDGFRSDSEAYFEKLKYTYNSVNKILLPGQTHNTFLLREKMNEGIDPARIIANIVLENSN